jgi:hypothetical protein
MDILVCRSNVCNVQVRIYGRRAYNGTSGGVSPFRSATHTVQAVYFHITRPKHEDTTVR